LALYSALRVKLQLAGWPCTNLHVTQSQSCFWESFSGLPECVHHSDPQIAKPQTLASCLRSSQILRRAAALPRVCEMRLGSSSLPIHRMQQPIRTPQAPAVARFIASAHQRNREEARSSRSGHLAALSTKFPRRSHIRGGLLGLRIGTVP
jgi:hypothetical protein